MAPSLHRALFALGSVVSVSSVGHQALFQHAVKPHNKQPSLADILGMLPDMKQKPVKTQAKPVAARRACTREDLAQSRQLLADYSVKAAEVKTKRQELIMAEFKRTVASMESTLEEFAQPFVNTTKELLSMIAGSTRPLIETDIRFLLEKVVRPKVPFNQSLTMAALEEAGNKWLEGLRKDLDAPQAELVHRALKSFNDIVDARVQKDYPELAKVMPGLPEQMPEGLHATEEFMIGFMESKALPVLISEAFPELAKVVAVLLKTPPPMVGATPTAVSLGRKESATSLEAYLKKELLPHMPSACQELGSALPRKLGERASGKLDAASLMRDLKSLVSGCTSMLKVPQRHLDLPPLPEKPDVPTDHCDSCLSVIQQHIITPFDKYSCLQACAPTVAMCTGGLNDACLRSSGGCLKCFMSSVAKMPGCEVDSERLAKLNNLQALGKVFAGGSIEEAGINDVSKAVTGALSDLLRLASEP